MFAIYIQKEIASNQLQNKVIASISIRVDCHLDLTGLP